MRAVSVHVFTLWLGLAGFAPTAFATPPGTNGHIAYTKLIDKGSPTERRAIFIDGGQVSTPDATDLSTHDDDSYPAFSPDGTQLAYLRHKGDTNDYVFYVAKADGTMPRRLGVLSDLDVAQWGIPNASTAQSLVWSPDGTRIGFVRKYVVPPFYADAIYTVSPVDGGFQRISDAPTGGMPFPGFDWQGGGPGKIGSIIERCSTTAPNTLFCAEDDLSGSFQGFTAFEPSVTIPANTLPGNAIPRWQPDPQGGKTRVLFSMVVPTLTGSSSVYTGSIFSILPAEGPNNPGSIGADLQEYTPGREVVTCPARENGNPYTAYLARYAYGNPYPSPDGKYFLASRTEATLEPDPHPFSPDNVSCSATTVANDLDVFRTDGAIQQVVDSDVDGSFGLTWQPSPANVTVSVNDGHGDELLGAVVELRDLNNPDTVIYGNPVNSSGGEYQFESVAPGKYLVRVTLDDAKSKAFEVRHGYPAEKAVWAQRSILIPADAQKVEKNFDFNDSVESSSLADGTIWYRLDAMAAIFFQTRRFVDWVRANLTTDTGAKVTMYTYASDNPCDPNVPTQYCLGSIYMGSDDSEYSNRNGSGQAPVNGEWHEFAHHLDDAFIYKGQNLACPGLNHAGYANATSCDSLREGFAMFLAAWANGSPDYAHIVDLELHTKAWGVELGVGGKLNSTEDEAVAALLWDIVDNNTDSEYTQAIGLGGAHLPVVYTDNINMPLRDLWTVLTSTGPVTVSDLRAALDASKPVSIDLDLDGVPDVTAVDELFLMHGFFPIASDQVITPTHTTYHYNVEGTRQNGNLADANANVGQTGHDFYTLNGLRIAGVNPRPKRDLAPAANLNVLAHDAAGRELQGVEVTMTVHYPGFDRPLSQVLPTGNGSLVHLELPMYFDYLPEDGLTTLPPCDPAHDVYVSVTLTASINGYPSMNSQGFDNCTYIQAQLAATGSVAASYTMTFPEDAAPPTTQITTVATGDVAGQYATGSWTVTLLCNDPVVGNFASGCFTTQYSIDGGAYVRYSGAVTISDPGLHTFSYLSRDAAGNAEPEATVSLGIVGQVDDQTPPVTTASAAASVAPVSPNVTTGFWTVSLSCSDPPGAVGAQVSGCQASEFSVDGSEFAPYTGPVVVQGVGQHVFSFFSYDVRGNYEQPAKSMSLEIKVPDDTVNVPSVLGLSQAAAASAIASVGLVVGSIAQQSSDTVSAGSVISQSPSAGTSVAPGSTINLAVSTGPAPVNVPNVIGLSQPTATSVISGAGLVVGSVTQQSSSTVPAGSVISQSPSAGTSVAAKSAVSLMVSTGPAPVIVPGVVGLTQATATSVIAGAGLVVGSVTQQSSGTEPAGSVISQSPSAGASVAAGSAVNLEVSTGPAPVSVPNVVGLSQTTATSAITSAGLVFGTITQQSSSTVSAGSVISQSPSAGTSVAAGSAVSLVISTGPAPVSVPSVVGLTQSAATSAVTSAGLVVGAITQQSSSTVPAGNVISQNPNSGTSVAAGSAVNLVVSTGSASGSSFDALKAATQATKISVQGLKDLLVADINAAQALYTNNRPVAALAAMEVYQGLVRAASGHSIGRADATNLLTLSEAVERDIRTKLRSADEGSVFPALANTTSSLEKAPTTSATARSRSPARVPSQIEMTGRTAQTLTISSASAASNSARRA